MMKLQIADPAPWKTSSLQLCHFVLHITFVIILCAGILLNNRSSNIYAENRKVTDDWITFKIETRFMMDEIIPFYLIDVQTRNGVVTLSGCVNNSLIREQSAGIAEMVTGVESVINSIFVTPHIHLQNQIAFDKKIFLPPYILKVEKKIQDALNEPIEKSDEEIKRTVEDVLFEDPRVISLNIGVEVRNGVVTLTGTVDSLNAKNTAKEIVKKIAGVSAVKNKLKVRPGILPSYSVVAENVRDALSRDPTTKHLDVSAEVQNNKVYLFGTVNTAYDKQYIKDVVSKVPGVVDIVNKLNIAPQRLPVDEDDKLKEKVETLLTFSVFVHSTEVSVDAKNSVVYLTGTVHNQQEASAAVENAFYGGARMVRNFLNVRGETDEELKQLRTEEHLYTEVDYPDLFEEFYFKPYYFYLYP